MNLNGIPFFNLMRDRMSYLDRRTQVIAENVANADTPGYVARDLRPFAEALGRQARAAPAGPVGTVRTHAMHLASNTPAPPAPSRWDAADSAGSETTLDGNQVVLEDEMIRMGEARMNYDAAVGFYQKSLSMLRMAARAPGR